MKLKIFSALTLIGTLSSCYRSPNDTIFVSDLDMVQTNYNPELKYGQEYTTFTIADSFALATNVDDVTPDDANDPKFVIPIKDAIMRNMLNFNYIFIPLDSVDTNNVPDIYIPITVTYINTKGVAYYPIYSPGWGWGYGGGYYGSWGGGYYNWGYIPTTFSYDQGSLIIDWIDVKNRRIVNDSVVLTDIVWDMGISGLIENSTGQDRTDRLNAAIDKGFEQSPYLNK